MVCPMRVGTLQGFTTPFSDASNERMRFVLRGPKDQKYRGIKLWEMIFQTFFWGFRGFFTDIPKELLITSFIIFFATSRMEFLGGGFIHILYFHPKLFGKMNPIGRSHIFQMGWWFNQQADFGWPEPDLQGGHRHCHGDLAGERPESASLLREPGNLDRPLWKSPQKTHMEPKKLVLSRYFSLFPSGYFQVPC